MIKGPPGNIANDDASLKSSLVPRTLWCADGDICSAPDGKNWIRHPGPNLVLGGTQNLNRWILHAPNDNRRGLWIAPDNGSDNWDWGKSQNVAAINGGIVIPRPARFENKKQGDWERMFIEKL